MTQVDRADNISRPVRAIVVDDESLGRELVLRLAADIEELDIVGEFGDAAKALEAVDTLHPDLAFFDIKMPRMTGLDAARRLRTAETIIVFITAFEEHALEAFEVQAFDYLLKPIEKERFLDVCDRVFTNVKRRRIETIMGESLEKSSETPGLNEIKRIKVRDGNRLRFIDPASVIHFEAANQYVQIHTVQGSYLISSESLSSLQEVIDPDIFIRVHRSSIINIRHALSIRVDDKGAYFIELTDGSRVRVSRSNRDRLKDLEI